MYPLSATARLAECNYSKDINRERSEKQTYCSHSLKRNASRGNLIALRFSSVAIFLRKHSAENACLKRIN